MRSINHVPFTCHRLLSPGSLCSLPKFCCIVEQVKFFVQQINLQLTCRRCVWLTIANVNISFAVVNKISRAKKRKSFDIYSHYLRLRGCYFSSLVHLQTNVKVNINWLTWMRDPKCNYSELKWKGFKFLWTTRANDFCHFSKFNQNLMEQTIWWQIN